MKIIHVKNLLADHLINTAERQKITDKTEKQ